MPDLVSSSDRLVSRPLALVTAAVAGMALAATVAMWVRYGGAVFYEMIAAGFAACF